MRDPQFLEFCDFEGNDCSEIAEILRRAAGGEGSIIRIESPRGNLSTVRILETLKNGQQSLQRYIYHEVFSDGRYIFDPRLSLDPIPLGDYRRLIRQLNRGVVFR